MEKLKDVFAKVHTNLVPKGALEMWQKAGLWDLDADIAAGLKITQDLPVLPGLELAEGKVYFGQTPTLHGRFFGRLEYNGGLCEGAFM